MNSKNLIKQFPDTGLEESTQKFLNIKLYLKTYIKEYNILNDSKKLYKTDSYQNFSNTTLSLPLTKGLSLATSTMTCKNVLNQTFKFELPSYLSTTDLTIKPLKNIVTILKGLHDITNKYTSLLILSVIKGGFKVYSFGFMGFLPYSQVLIFLKNFTLKLKTFLHNHPFTAFAFFTYAVNSTGTLLLRVPSIKLGKLNFYAFSLKKFSIFKRKRLEYNNIRLIFLINQI